MNEVAAFVRQKNAHPCIETYPLSPAAASSLMAFTAPGSQLDVTISRAGLVVIVALLLIIFGADVVRIKLPARRWLRWLALALAMVLFILFARSETDLYPTQVYTNGTPVSTSLQSASAGWSSFKYTMIGIFFVQVVLLAKLGRDHRADLLEYDGSVRCLDWRIMTPLPLALLAIVGGSACAIPAVSSRIQFQMLQVISVGSVTGLSVDDWATTSASAYYFTDGVLASDQMLTSRVAETEVAVTPIVSESSGDVVMVAFSIRGYPMTQLSATLQPTEINCLDGIAPSMAPSVVPGELCVHRLNLGGAMELAASACTQMLEAKGLRASRPCGEMLFALGSATEGGDALLVTDARYITASAALLLLAALLLTPSALRAIARMAPSRKMTALA